MLRVIVCPDCWTVTRHSDPAQGELFTRGGYGKPWSLDAMLASYSRRPRDFDAESHPDSLLTTEPSRHPEWPKHTTVRERRAYPFH